MEKTGIAGRIAKTFLMSKLTPLIIITALLLGVFAIIVTPREEEPQILVPMVDVFVQYPGASAKEVEDRVTKPMEKLLWEIKGVEYVYSISKPGTAITIVRFYVGENMEDSLVKLYNKLMSNYDRIPPGVSEPLVKPKSIDDVPILSLTLWSERYSGYELRSVADEVAEELKKDPDTSEITITGGQRRQLRVVLEPSRLKAYNISALRIFKMLKGANASLPSGMLVIGNKEFVVETGKFFMSAEDVGNLVVGVYDGRPVYLKNAAEIIDGPEEPSNYVLAGFGPASEQKPDGLYDAVTIAIAKKKGTNATLLADRSLEKVEELKGVLIPGEIEVAVTRNYGDTAKEKSDSLLEHMLIAAISVTILIAIALGLRESLIVGVAVPVTLALTILVNYMYGYTLNRVTLFALIFSIGILVDDAIVVVENIHRHFKLKGVSPETAIRAVDEVGNPTILATFTVIAALLPMAFVSGLMGPYMRPIPVGASAAMLISLLIAFIISPWLSYIVLKKTKKQPAGEKEEGRLMGFFNRLYEKNLRGLLESSFKRMIAFLLIILLLGGSVMLLYFKLVTVKMLPFDNKSELQVIIDMPEGTTLEQTAMVSTEVGVYLRTVPEVMNYQLYVGTAAPFNFNGLVRHYFLRAGSNVADIQVNFVPRDKRKAQSHDIAKRIRPGIQEIGRKYNANIKIVEVPPGPPVLSTLVAEIYGPDFNRQIGIAEEIKTIFEETGGVVDTDWYVEDGREKITFVVDKEKAAYHGITTESISKTLRIALGGMPAGLLHVEDTKEPVEIFLRAPLSERASIGDLKEISMLSASGKPVSLSELVRVERGIEDRTRYRKNLKRVVYVTGDVAGTEESPVYAILKMKDKIRELRLPEGYELKQYDTKQPRLEDRYSMKWDGEWHITLQVFRDLGIAFAAVIVIIYVMVVGWFKSFITPLVILAPIPLSLVGILPGHALMGAFFTATSMIGFIAGAGIVIRNSIILVDFIEQQLREGMPLKEAVVQAGIIRFRPMLLTASAVVVGSSVILFDPIFQGMAISLMAGEVASTLLSRTLVPVLYYMYKERITN
ncbi:MAG TPA: efflux RND transporter permease subunit [Nitrospirae bacterium]|nr:multidrug resistance protein MdtC [bacterium BMS3Abin06]HDH11072.1 efflux RND transporter permease subunit [Nitrospirota bacterium]HDZ01701.1 efflux RND transporter permease subunit [Nitrospirota bacterium]